MHQTPLRIPLVAIAIAALATAPACRRNRITGETDEGVDTRLASVVAVADPHTASQLLNGFYGVENNAWRWTKGRFAVVLRPPRTAPQKGATLRLHLTIPDPSIALLKSVAVSASVNGTALPPETYTRAGSYVYSRDVPSTALAGGGARVEFALDKTLPPTPNDHRELGVVVSTVGFEAK